ncbi:MAG: glycine cleavage system protein T [Anaerolineaceae bacterium]|nr:glycine cleavage system protein T [Anaerolineaceae bacterium]
MNLQDLYQLSGAIIAPDGIPLHFGDQKAEYEAAQHAAVLMDRSHEGRLETTGRDRLEVIQRISTNDIGHMALGEGRPTILTTPTGRIIDRLMVYNFGEKAIVTSEPGRGQIVRDFLQRQIFFNDDMSIQDLSTTTRQFALHGVNAEAVVQQFVADAGKQPYLESINSVIGGVEVIFLKRKPLVGTQWIVIVPTANAAEVWQTLLLEGQNHGLVPAGSLTFNVLRIQAGRPGVGRELSTDFIPLEAGLWDEVSFKKGCYTGQEIIARMESRHKLAKTMVTLKLTQMVETPNSLRLDGTETGTITSSVLTPDGEAIGIGFVKVAAAEPGKTFAVGDQKVTAQVLSLAGAQPPMLENHVQTSVD